MYLFKYIYIHIQIYTYVFIRVCIHKDISIHTVIYAHYLHMKITKLHKTNMPAAPGPWWSLSGANLRGLKVGWRSLAGCRYGVCLYVFTWIKRSRSSGDDACCAQNDHGYRELCVPRDVEFLSWHLQFNS